MKTTEYNEKVLAQFAEMIIERMKKMKASDWKKGWFGGTVGSPMNIDGGSYRGMNVLLLMFDSAKHGYELPVYCTLRQANRIGAHINKGSKAMPVLFWDFSYTTPDGRKIKEDDFLQLPDAMRGECKKNPFLKCYHVFNISQTNISEVKPDKYEKLKTIFNLADARDDSGMYENASLDNLLVSQSWVCPIQYDKPSEGAYYSIRKDMIVVPQKCQFKMGRSKKAIYQDGQEYYSSLIPEMIHST